MARTAEAKLRFVQSFKQGGSSWPRFRLQHGSDAPLKGTLLGWVALISRRYAWLHLQFIALPWFCSQLIAGTPGARHMNVMERQPRSGAAPLPGGAIDLAVKKEVEKKNIYFNLS